MLEIARRSGQGRQPIFNVSQCHLLHHSHHRCQERKRANTTVTDREGGDKGHAHELIPCSEILPWWSQSISDEKYFKTKQNKAQKNPY